MSEVTDILCEDDSGDIQVKNGDMVIGDATFQHQQDLLSASEGEYKADPLVGVGLAEFLDDEGPSDMMKKIRVQFGQDGMNVKTARINESGKMEIDAVYQ